MKLKKITLTLLCISTLLSSCASTLSVQSDSDTQYDLSSYKTYSIVSPSLKDQEEMISINPILTQRIARSLETVLSQKGLQKSDQPDLTVRFYLGSNREIERSTDLGGFGYYGYRYLDSRDQRYIRSENDEISIRFHDTSTKDVVWYAFTRFKRPSDQYNQQGVNSLIEELLADFN